MALARTMQQEQLGACTPNLCHFLHCLAEFVELPGVGHCPQDEAPEIVNPLIEAWVLNTMTDSSSSSSWQQPSEEAAAGVTA
jgi:hypothetical protein